MKNNISLRGAILEALKVLSKNKSVTANEVSDYVIDNFKFNTTDKQTRYSISATLGTHYIHKNIVKRVKKENIWHYYLPEYENNYDFNVFDSNSVINNLQENNIAKIKKNGTLTESILEALKILSKNKPVTANEVYNYLINHNTTSDTKRHSVNSVLSKSLTEKGIVLREKIENKYCYYLSEYKNNSNYSIPDTTSNNLYEHNVVKLNNKTESKNYNEQDLHILLSTYLHHKKIFSKTIHQEKSNRSDDNQMWTHPDMIGVKFPDLKTTAKAFSKAVNLAGSFTLYSYELKIKITNDGELKKSFFQALSNSSWANYGYLVALEIKDSLKDEIERLNQAFGIGIIKINANNPKESEVLFQPKRKELDFITIEKLCNINPEFDKFTDKVTTLLLTEDKYYKPMENDFIKFCDKYLESENEIKKYCIEKQF